MRFGAPENLYGYKEIAEFRKGRPATDLPRTVTRLDNVSFGKDFASITLEFERGTQRGRQSQTWARLPRGSRIVAAHVFLITSLYVVLRSDFLMMTLVAIFR
jgi:Protein of unknown function (DUF3225)